MPFAAKNRLFCALLLSLLLNASHIFGQGACTSPTGVKISAILSEKITVTWDASNTSSGNNIQLSWAEYPGHSFIYKSFSGTSAEIIGLKPNTKYIVRASKLCGANTSLPVGLGVLRTLSVAEEQAFCSSNSGNEICALLKGTECSERGNTFITITLPELPAALVQNPALHHNYG